MRKGVLLLLALYAAPCFAGAEKPPEIAPYIHTATPYGEGTYSRMWVKAYDAALWTDASSWSFQSPFALTLHYRMHFTSQQLTDRSLEEMDHIEPLSKTEKAEFGAQLSHLLPAVKSDDVITALYIPRKGATIFYNGAPTGHIADDDLARGFLDIWLSDKTSAPDLRQQLLAHSGARKVFAR